MPSIFTTFVAAAAIAGAGTALAAPANAATEKCVASYTTNFILSIAATSLSDLGAVCVDSAFNFINNATSPKCQNEWTTCFLDAKNSTATIHGPLGYVGLKKESDGTEVFTSSATTKPIVWEFDPYAADIVPNAWILFYEHSWPTYQSLDSPIVELNFTSQLLISPTMQVKV